MPNLPSPVEDLLLAEEDVTLEPAASGSDCNFMVLGVGAAAGGLEAFTELLRALPQDVGVAVVFVHHPLDGREQGLAQQLAAHTAMTVVAVTGPTALAPGHLYVAADGAALTVTDRVLTPTAPPAGSPSGNPVDTFFTSLARAVENCAVGVVLSGSGSDGIIGLREIKGVGGITIAQEPDSAHYDSMPRAAIATGAVDLVLTPQRIAEELQRIGRHPYVRQSAPRRPTDDLVIQPEQLHRIFTMLRNGSGVDFTHYKPPTIRRRLQRRMVLQKLDSVEHYIRFMRENPDEITKLYQDLLIHVTRFFRDPDSFRALCTEVFPKIMLNRRSAHPIRIWLPGCSTGEEAYSVAIALLEHLGEDASAVQVQIFATDVSETAIEQARNGLYPDSVAADLTPERLRRFFTKTDGKYRIAKIVRDICVFARQDVTRDPPFSKLDLILCRNVLIYMGAVLQRKLMTVFHYALKPSGFLMLGGAETVGSQAELFAVVDKRHRIFSRKLAESPAHLNLPLEYTPERGPAGRGARVPRETHSGLTFQGEVNRLILDRYGPPGVIVDEDFQIVQFRGKTGAFLEPAPGDVAQSLNLLKMAREGLLHGLQTALFSARKGDKPVRKDGLRVHTHGGIREVNLQVIPFAVPGENRHYLVLFEDTATPGDGVESAPPPVPAPSDDLRVKQLQDELVASREYLQSIIQDLEAANEELQSANEEILSSNEELQSTNEELDTAKEELQSTNEELNTVNEELHGRNEELSRVNSDLVNLLGCVEIAIVIVGADLGIRRFTPMAEKVLNLIPTDIGRPISQIKPNIECPGLERMIARVIDTVTIQESNVRDSEGNWYLLRIRPYKNVENRIDGAVLALFDIAHRRHELELRQAREHTRAILETVREPVLVLDGHLRVQIANRAFCGAFQLPVDAVLHRCIYDLGHGQWDLPALRTLLEDVLQRHARFEHFRVEHEFIGLGRRALVIDACRLDGGDMGATTFILAILDVTGRDAGHGRVGLSS